MVKRLFFLFVLMASLPIHASGSLIQYWKSVSITTDSGDSVEITLNPETFRADTFKVTIDGKETVLEEKWHSDLYFYLNSLRVLASCTLTPLPSEPTCVTSVSMELELSVDDGDPPSWYEPSEVKYIFAEGKFIERWVKTKVSESRWENKILKVE